MSLHWLRRIPAVTRIVVLVVFLALFQSVLLSVFGLVAIGHERRQVEDQIRGDAERFLRTDLVPQCQYDLRDLADVAFAVAFDPEGGRLEETTPLFIEAYRLPADGRILAPGGEPLLLGHEAMMRDEEEARGEAQDLAERFRLHEVGIEEKSALDVAFARRHPFARDEFGESLALLFSSTPILSGEQGSAALLEARWIGVLNRLAGHIAPTEVERFLRRIDALGSGDPSFAAGLERQERRAERLHALRLELSRLPRDGKPHLHSAGERHRFYLRPGAGEAGFSDLQALAVDERALRAYLSRVVEGARGRAREGVTPAIVPAAEASPLQTAVAMDLLTGYVAVATISSAAVRTQAADRERFYWYIIGFSVSGILAGGFLTVRAVTREVKLAKLKSGFVSNVTHELKTPLTSIRMFVEMLSGGKVTDEAEREECLGVISQETERLGKLIQQVLDFGRLEGHRRRFHWVIGPLAPLVARETERFRRAKGLTPEELRLSIAADLRPVSFDASAFSEVIGNLLSNAWKYSPAKGKRILVSLSAAAGRVALAVEDNGPGVPPGERERIFDQFYRVDDRVTRDVEGTGLGLAIARGIVRSHGGRIRVEDSPSGGCRFVVRLPASRRRQEAREGA